MRAAPGCSVQDGGRPGRLAAGLPPSGPLDAAAHAAANLAVGNAPDAASIEVPLGALTVCARSDMRVSIDGEPPVALAAGATLEVPACARAVRYLAVAGGIDVPIVLGARATLVVAGVGGHEGRALRSGDVLALARATSDNDEDAPRRGAVTPPDPDDPAALRVSAGPHLLHLPPQAFDVFLGSTWVVSQLGDRVGVRLEGAKVPRAPARDLAGPVPLVRGAVQVSTDGAPIVLGPDHPVTGGYPVIAVVHAAAQALLARVRPGGRVRFVL